MSPAYQERAKNRRIAAMLALSVLVHAGVMSGAWLDPGRSPQGRTRPRAAALRAATLQSGHLGERARDVLAPVAIVAERYQLIQRARADRARGSVALGEFLLAAQSLDDREEQRAFDLDKARALYAERLQALQGALIRLAVRDAVAEVFADLQYHGRPGGRMGDVLLDGGGSCEPLAQLLAAAVHDAGDPAGAALRYYGGRGQSGATHLAPVYATGGKEYDLLSGGPAIQKGTKFAAVDLIEVYARAHGLSDPTSKAPLAGSPASAPRRPATDAASRVASERTLGTAYPANADRYPGTTPAFESRAVQPPTEEEIKPFVPLEAREQALDCAFFVRMAVLDPPVLGMADPATSQDRFSVELRRVPSQAQLDRTYVLIQAAEEVTGDLDAPVERLSRSELDRKTAVDRLMGLACLTALYDRAAVDFALAGERRLSALAAENQKKAATAGATMLEGTDWSQREGVWLIRALAERFAGRNWLLLVLRGGDKVVFELAKNTWRDDWGRINALAALLVAPATRTAALDIVEKLPHHEQVDVMHEIFHAHDHLRPWASNYALHRPGGDPAAVREFSRAYRVFRGVAYGLWEGVRAPGEVLDVLEEGARLRRLDRRWVEMFIDYYRRNALILHQNRPDSRAFTWELNAWLRKHGYARADRYR